jgi:hypothetical protein
MELPLQLADDKGKENSVSWIKLKKKTIIPSMGNGSKQCQKENKTQ